MKNNTNIYDIDGELIRKAGDNHEFTIEEVQERLRHYREKLEDPNTDDKKAAVYRNYMTNLSNYAALLMSKMDKDDIINLFNKNNVATTNKEDIIKALNDTDTGRNTEDEVSRTTTDDTESNTDEECGDATPIERGCSDVPEGLPITQDDLLVERRTVNDNMDEYVDFKES